MSLIVEDGSAKSDAESYVSVADAETYFGKFGACAEWDAAEESEQETALRTATRHIDMVYGQRFTGTKYTSEQALLWPRSSAVVNGWTLDIDDIPQQLKDACCEIARRYFTETDGLLVDVSDPGPLKSRTIQVGPIREQVEWTGGSSDQKVFTIVDSIIGPLLTGRELERG